MEENQRKELPIFKRCWAPTLPGERCKNPANKILFCKFHWKKKLNYKGKLAILSFIIMLLFSLYPFNSSHEETVEISKDGLMLSGEILWDQKFDKKKPYIDFIYATKPDTSYRRIYDFDLKNRTICLNDVYVSKKIGCGINFRFTEDNKLMINMDLRDANKTLQGRISDNSVIGFANIKDYCMDESAFEVIDQNDNVLISILNCSPNRYIIKGVLFGKTEVLVVGDGSTSLVPYSTPGIENFIEENQKNISRIFEYKDKGKSCRRIKN